MQQKPQNLFFTTTFALIILGGVLYSKPIILAIIERGFNADRGFDLASGLIIGAIATQKKMQQEHVYTPDDLFGIKLAGRNKSDVIAQQIAQPTIDIAESVQPISQAIDEVKAVQDVLNPVADVAKVAQMIAPNDLTVNAIANTLENPLQTLEQIRL